MCRTSHGLTVVGMRSLSSSQLHANLASVLDSVVDDSEDVVVTRAGHEPAVIVSLAAYESLKEQAYLLRSPANARRLLAAIEELESGGGQVRSV